jgi:serine/threonine protein kinase
VDWWALGVLVYEMLAGFPPFCSRQVMLLYHKILTAKISYPSDISMAARDLIGQLLTRDKSKRIGNRAGGVAELKNHVWFAVGTSKNFAS